MYSTYFDRGNVSRSVISTFGGINRRARIGDGECADMQNMTSDAYPLLSSRKPRTVAQRQLTETTGDGDSFTITVKSLNGILGDVGFCAVWGTDFYYLGNKISGISLIDGEKRLIAFGAYILIYPDQKYYNTVTGESGAMETVETVSGTKDVEISWETDATTGGTFSAACFEFAENSAVESVPGSKDGELSLTIPVQYNSEKQVAIVRIDYDAIRKQYRTQNNVIMVSYAPNTPDENSVYVRIANGRMEYLYDRGSTHAADVWRAFPVSAINLGITETGYLWNGDAPVKLVGGMVHLAEPGDLSSAFSSVSAASNSTKLTCVYSWTKSNLPRLDYVCALDNRLWGCRYGMQAGSNTTVNEIYCSALGDFKNFTTGTTADAAWAASVGAHGKWTGCVSLNGRVLFFKDEKLLRVTGTKPANFQYAEISDIGLQDGCERSLQIIDGVLYYKSRDGIYVYDGSLPQRISDKLGDAQYAKTAVAGSIYGKYYIALDSVLYVYDTGTGLWTKEDAQDIRYFTRYSGALYAAIGQDIVCVCGEADGIFTEAAPEGKFEWSAESGDLGLDTPYQKYYKRILIRAHGDFGTNMTVSAAADGAEPVTVDCIFDGMETAVIPIETPRCDHVRLKISGSGAIKIYSVSYETETVGDLPERR